VRPAGPGTGTWLPVAHAAANETEMQMVSYGFAIPVTAITETAAAVSRRIAAAPPAGKWAAAGIAIALGVLVVWLVRTGKTKAITDRIRPVIREIGEATGPPLLETPGTPPARQDRLRPGRRSPGGHHHAGGKDRPGAGVLRVTGARRGHRPAPQHPR
jgi:hypothetical protein